MVDSSTGVGGLAPRPLAVERPPELRARVPEESRTADAPRAQRAGGVPEKLPSAEKAKELKEGGAPPRGSVVDVEA